MSTELTVTSLSPNQRCLLILVIGLLGGWLGAFLAIELGTRVLPQLPTITTAQVPLLVKYAWWSSFFYNFIFILLIYASIQGIARWQTRKSVEDYRRRLNNTDLLEQIHSGSADFGLFKRVIARQPWLIRSNFHDFPDPVGDRYRDIGHIGLFLDLYLEHGRNHRLYLRPTPVFLFAPFIAAFLGLLSHFTQILLPQELAIFDFIWIMIPVITILKTVDQMIGRGFAWHRMLLAELGEDFRAEVRRCAEEDELRKQAAKGRS